jgi:hypothetical protein
MVKYWETAGSMLATDPGEREARLAAVTSDAYGEYSYNYAVVWKLRRIFPLGWRTACRCGQYCFGRSVGRREFPLRRSAVILLTATALPLATGGPSLSRALPGRK